MRQRCFIADWLGSNFDENKRLKGDIETWRDEDLLGHTLQVLGLGEEAFKLLSKYDMWSYYY